LPAKEFLPQVVDVRDGDAYYRMAGLFKSCNLGILCGVWGGFEARIRENAVVAIDVRRAECFAIYRNDALAEFAGGFGDELLEPRSQVGDAGRGDERDFVTAKFCRRTHDDAEEHSWILLDGNCGGASLDHFLGAPEKFVGVHAHRGCGDHSEIRERGVAAAD